MNKKLLFGALGFIIIGATANIVARPYILKNNSAWDIKIIDKEQQRFFAPETAAKIEKLIPAGTSLELDTRFDHALRRSGKGSSYISGYYDIPVKKLLGNQINSRLNQTPVVAVGSDWTGGWDFKLEWQ